MSSSSLSSFSPTFLHLSLPISPRGDREGKKASVVAGANEILHPPLLDHRSRQRGRIKRNLESRSGVALSCSSRAQCERAIGINLPLLLGLLAGLPPKESSLALMPDFFCWPCVCVCLSRQVPPSVSVQYKSPSCRGETETKCGRCRYNKSLMSAFVRSSTLPGKIRRRRRFFLLLLQQQHRRR